MIQPIPKSATRGFSLVELMVAMTIGLIGIIIMLQVFQTSEGIKRTTTSGGDAQQNGAIALYNIEHDMRNAGMGFNETAYTECRNAGTVLGYNSDRGTPDFATVANPLLLVPVLITAGGSATTPDQVKIFYGAQGQVAGGGILAKDMTDPLDSILLKNNYGYRAGDLIVLLQPGSGKNCSLMEVTQSSVGLAMLHDTTNYPLTWITGTPVKSPRFNKGGGLGVTYTGAGSTSATRVFNLGNLHDTGTSPVLNTYSISNNTLMVQSDFTIVGGLPATNPVADNIVHMRALYGMANGTFTATTPANWQLLVSVRVAVVARSSNYEKPPTGSATCDATPAAPTWSGGSFDLTGLGADWKCYRYRVFETTVPLRNWIWSAS